MAHHIEHVSNEAEASNGSQIEFKELVAQAASKYSIKDYDAAAELYSRATELQAVLVGEMAAENADLLYAYGRCLYHAAVRNSDVLGSKIAGEKRCEGNPKFDRRKDARKIDEQSSESTKCFEKGSNHVPENVRSIAQSGNVPNPDRKFYFQFTGDEDLDDTAGESDTEQPDEKTSEEAEEDDFANAFEILDLARVLLLKRIEQEEEMGHGKGEAKADDSDTVRQLKERLADTYDLQAEISLEGERFPNAVDDLRAALNLKMKLFQQESSIIAEAHYKLSLALEFSSVTQHKSKDDATATKVEAQIDEAMREEAAKQMEASIASCRLRISKEQAKLHAEDGINREVSEESRKGSNTQKDVDDVKEMVADMEQRLIELRQPPLSFNGGSASNYADGIDRLGGFLSSLVEDSPTAQRRKLDEASRGATDLSSLVKRKKISPDMVTENTDGNNDKGDGKRKAEAGEFKAGTEKKVKMLNDNEDRISSGRSE
ncbi:MAG: hypothetical protein Q9219_006199 [cf. Caloplaca sp. 3 TL-2023]